MLVRNIGSAGCFLLLGFAAYWTLRIGYADYLARRSPEDIVRAVALIPQRADYWVRLAEFEEAQGKDGRASLTQAIRLNPNDAQIWTDLGLQEELAGNFATAEKDLLEAARVSKQFDPRWSLANYFLRRNDERFWYWIRQAFLMSYGDRRPLYQLCWNFSSNPDEILSRAIPEDNRVLGPYLAFLLGYDRFRAADAVALKMLDRASDEDVTILLSYCTRTFVARWPGKALEVWNGLAQKKLLPYASLDPVKGPVLTNGDFQVDPSGDGFDWRVPQSEGILANREPVDPPYFKVQFSGKQPEVCELLVQYLPLDQNRHYELRFDYQTSGIASDNGLSWRLYEADGTILSLGSPQLVSDAWKAERLSFVTTKSGAARLVLLYERRRGTTRIEGSIALRRIGVTP